MPKETINYLEKVTSEIKYICIEHNLKYLYSVAITKTGKQSNCREIINGAECKIGI